MNTTMAWATADDRLWRRSMRREHGFEALRVEGTLPPELRGTCVRNGPGMMESAGRRYDHPFDGDGALCAVRVEGGAAWGAHRLVMSAGLKEERARGKALYGSAAPWPRRVLNVVRRRDKNSANTHVVPWQGRLLALWEGGRPTEVRLRDLETLGETDLGGVVGTVFSAHPHHVVARRAMYNFGVEYGRTTKLALYELPDEGPARRLGDVPLGVPLMVHDFIATERHLVFLLSPAVVNVAKALLGARSSSLLQWEAARGTEVVVVPIGEPTRVTRFHVAAFFQWHFANAFERGDAIVVDFVRRPDLTSLADVGSDRIATGECGLYRATIHPARRAFRSEVLWGEACEFPRVDPRRAGGAYGRAWVTARTGSRHGLARVDVESGKVATFGLSESDRASEPVFVPRGEGAEEDDGWILSLVLDGRRDTSHLAVYDARRLDDGPVARVHFEEPVPVTFHGSWVAAP